MFDIFELLHLYFQGKECNVLFPSFNSFASAPNVYCTLTHHSYDLWVWYTPTIHIKSKRITNVQRLKRMYVFTSTTVIHFNLPEHRNAFEYLAQSAVFLCVSTLRLVMTVRCQIPCPGQCCHKKLKITPSPRIRHMLSVCPL